MPGEACSCRPKIDEVSIRILFRPVWHAFLWIVCHSFCMFVGSVQMRPIEYRLYTSVVHCSAHVDSCTRLVFHSFPPKIEVFFVLWALARQNLVSTNVTAGEQKTAFVGSTTANDFAQTME